MFGVTKASFNDMHPSLLLLRSRLSSQLRNLSYLRHL